MTSGAVDNASRAGAAGVLAGLAVLTVGLGAAVLTVQGGATVPWVVTALFAMPPMAALPTALLTRRWLSAGDVPSAATASSAAEVPLAAAAEESPPALDQFQVEQRGVRRIVPARDVEWIEAQGNYARLHAGGSSFLFRAPLSDLEPRLAGAGFVRVHRSAILNTQALREVRPLRSGDALLRTRSGHELRLSRRYARAFNERAGRASVARWNIAAST